MKLPLFKTLPNVYDPSEDSFLLMDALESIKDSNPTTIWEICCGTGSVGAYAKYLFPNAHVVCSDKYSDPCINTKDTFIRNSLRGDVVQMDLLENVKKHSVDLILCNPPYVPSEYHLEGIDAAWAGGLHGNSAVTIPLINIVEQILSKDGQLLLLLLKVNFNDNLQELCNARSLSFKCIIERQCGREYLYVFSIKRLH